MKKVILYLEDDANMRRHTTELLTEKGYQVEDFRRIDQAKEFISKRHAQTKCIITDLNMSDEWLEKYQSESDGCILSGWVWLHRYAYSVMPNIPTIIYSGYITYLEKWLFSQGQEELLKSKNIVFVEKGDGDDEGFNGLINALQNKLGIMGEEHES